MDGVGQSDSTPTDEYPNETNGLLSHENEELRDRVAALEKKVQLQEDDLICLKSALSDCLRRLGSVESSRGNTSSKASSRTPVRRTAGHSSLQVSSSSRKQLISDASPRQVSPAHRAPKSSGVPSSASSAASSTASSVSKKISSSGDHNSNMSSTRFAFDAIDVDGRVNLIVDPPHGQYSRPMTPAKKSALTSPLVKGTAGLSHSLAAIPCNANQTHPRPYFSTSIDNTNVRRSGSMASLTGRAQPQSARAKEPAFNQDEGVVKFYMRGRALNFYAPTDVQNYDVTTASSPPPEKLKLEWAYGYRGRDARCNLYLLPTGEMVYFIAGIVVLYNVEEQMQRHYTGHTDDVKCLAVHPDKITIATGQVAGHDKREGKHLRKKDAQSGSVEIGDNWPHIRIWDSVSLNTLRVIGLGDFDRAVACVAFSKADGGQYIVAVDEANEHVISLWDWQKGEKGHRITETKSSTEPVLAAEFHPCERNVIVTCGKGQISFWNIDGGTLSRKQGIFERHDKPKYVTCVAFAENGDVLSGDSNGNLYVWGRESIEEEKKASLPRQSNNRISQAVTGAHEGGIFSICVMKDGTVVTGGKDRRIVEWNSTYKRTGREHELPEQFGSVRMLSQGKGSALLCGTTKNCVLQGSLDLKFSAIVQGHMEEVWGLATHPNQHQFVSCGYDHTLYMWDALTHSSVWAMQLADGAHSAAFHPDGSIVVVGTQTPRWLVIDVTTHEVLATHTDGSEQIECVSFSTDGKLIALGSRDNNIYVYSVDNGGRQYNRQNRFSGHSSFVTHVDWSVDGQFLRSNSGDYELLFWTVLDGKQVTSASSMRDVQWATQTCTLAFNSCGIWPEGADGTDVNACSRSHKQSLVASADDYGKVNLYSYPCSQPRAQGHIYGGHSSHVTNVQFLHDDSRLISTGGKDTAVFQWEILA